MKYTAPPSLQQNNKQLPTDTFDWRTASIRNGLKTTSTKKAKITVSETRTIQEHDLRLAHLASIIAHSHEAIFTKDMNAMITSWNPGAERLYGYSAKEIIGKSVETLCPEERVEEIAMIMDKVAKGEDIQDWQTLWRTKDGDIIEVCVSVSPLFNTNRKIVGASVIAHDLSERKKTEERFYKLAYYDQLTGLPNRTLFYELVKKELLLAQEKNTQCAIMFLDIDDFKDINDTLGHDIGDQLLHAVAERLQGCLRKRDIVARQGGDEFTLILPDVKGTHSPRMIAKRIIHEIAKPLRLQEHEVHITPSIGIALFPQNAKDAQDLIMYADSAMYIAKRRGGNRHEFYAEEFFNKSVEKLSFEYHLRNALAQNEFSVVYQTQYDLHRNRVFAVEALLRWNSPELGEISPSKFIPVAQRMGFMHEILAWTLSEVCQHIPRLHKLGIQVSLNISTHQLTMDFLNLLKQTLKMYSLTGSMIHFEIREADEISDMAYMKKILEEICHMGITLSIDNFGIGYSSLGYLYLLPIKRIKIDKSFVHNLVGCKRNLQIVKAILAMGHQLDMEVIAEGVETSEELETLKSLGCDYAQGFFINKPQSMVKLMQQLKR